MALHAMQRHSRPSSNDWLPCNIMLDGSDGYVGLITLEAAKTESCSDPGLFIINVFITSSGKSFSGPGTAPGLGSSCESVARPIPACVVRLYSRLGSRRPVVVGWGLVGCWLAYAMYSMLFCLCAEPSIRTRSDLALELQTAAVKDISALGKISNNEVYAT